MNNIEKELDISVTNITEKGSKLTKLVNEINNPELAWLFKDFLKEVQKTIHILITLTKEIVENDKN